MTSVYERHLHEAFPHQVTLTMAAARIAINHLMSYGVTSSMPSSWAVTSDTREPMTVKLWLSEASYDRLPPRFKLKLVHAEDIVDWKRE